MKANRKRFSLRAIAASLALVMAFLLTGCGGGSGDNPGNSANPDQSSGSTNGDFGGRTLTVGIWGGNDQETAAINQLKANFEAEHNCTVDLKVYTDYNTQIQADFIGQTAPDVFYIDGSMFPFYSSLGVMKVLDRAEYELDQFYPNLVEAFTDADGNVQCVPKDVSTLATYYNIDLLESVGYKPEDIPDDYAQYMSFLTDLQAKLDETYGKNQVAAMTYNQDVCCKMI